MTHQWLLLDQPDRVWRNFEWFCSMQTSPGLYTWWEGTREENTFHLWENVRGWVKPPHVTPHYWTAGEILALQVDMLAYVDESGSEPVLVIGGGVPKPWIGQPHARGRSCRRAWALWIGAGGTGRCRLRSTAGRRRFAWARLLGPRRRLSRQSPPQHGKQNVSGTAIVSRIASRRFLTHLWLQ